MGRHRHLIDPQAQRAPKRSGPLRTWDYADAEAVGCVAFWILICALVFLALMRLITGRLFL